MDYYSFSPSSQLNRKQRVAYNQVILLGVALTTSAALVSLLAVQGSTTSSFSIPHSSIVRITEAPPLPGMTSQVPQARAVSQRQSVQRSSLGSLGQVPILAPEGVDIKQQQMKWDLPMYAAILVAPIIFLVAIWKRNLKSSITEAPEVVLPLPAFHSLSFAGAHNTASTPECFDQTWAANHSAQRYVSPVIPAWQLLNSDRPSHSRLNAIADMDDTTVEFDDEDEPEPNQVFKFDPSVPRVPITLLSGFLGTGKTTTLKHLLENKEGLRIGVIVNDVAAVNIDAQLIQNAGVVSSNDTLQLQNGCACCSMQDELLVSVGQLLSQGRFDHIVIELSGVAEPARVQASIEYASEIGDPLANTLQAKNVVTLVDVSTFGELCISEARLRDRKELGGEESNLAEENVAMLLIEQIECANLVILNKVDLTSEEDLAIIKAYIQELNKDAKIITAEYGKVSPQVLLEGIVEKKEQKSDAEHDHKEEHSHEKGHAADHSDDDHDHDHEHDHDHDHHDHHDHSAAAACTDPNCTDPSHHHDHDHDHDHECNDPNCTDPSHHHHDHTPKDTTRAKERFGISTVVYKARRPFNTPRLIKLVEKWPVPRKSLLKDQVKLLEKEQVEPSAAMQHPFTPLLRSKGFVWATSNPLNRIEWSHAGKHFGMYDMGPWWANFTEEELRKFVPPEELDKIMKEQFEGEFGDRRIELVFIGIGIDEKKLYEELDKCLLTDKEMVQFRRELDKMEKPLTLDEEEGIDDYGRVQG